MATLKTRLLLRNDTTANWTTYQEMVLSKGEAGVEWYIDATTKQTMTKLKIGDGVSTWAQLPYIQQGMIAASVTTDNGGNTVVSAQVDYSNGVYTIKLLKKNRVVDIEVSDDNVVDLSVTRNWNEVGGTNKGHKITASHKTYHTGTVPSTTVTATGNKTPAADYTINIPKVTIDKYGHTTNIENQAVVVKAHDVTVTNDGNTTGNTIISITKGSNNHEIKYTKGNRLTGSGLTADTILLGNGGYDVKTSSKKLESTLTNDDTKVPTSKAVYAEIQEVLKIANAAMTLVGTLGDSASGATHTSLSDASESQLGDAYKVIKAGTYGGITAKAGDLIVCYKPTSTTYAWILIPAGDDIEDSWRAVQLDGSQKLSTATSSGALNLKNVTAKSVSIAYNSGFEFDVKTGYTTSGKNYAVKKDSSGNLYVNVPWTDTTNSYTASAGIKIVNNDIQHTNSVTAGTASGESGTTAKALGATVTLPSVTYDAQGHITKKGTTSFVLPDATEVQKGIFTFGKVKVGSNTAEADVYNDTLTVSGDTWIIPAVTASTDTLSFTHKAGTAFKGTTAAKNLTWSDTSFIVPQITTDAGGHVTSASNITINIPKIVVSNTTDGLAPKIIKANSFLMSKDGTSPLWDNITIMDGGSASTTNWGTIS